MENFKVGDCVKQAKKIEFDDYKVKQTVEDLLDFYEISVTQYRHIEDENDLEKCYAENDTLMFATVMNSLGFYIKECFNKDSEIIKVQVYFNERLISEREYNND